MKKNKILIISFSIIILLLIIVIIIRINTSLSFRVKTFKHKDTSSINFEYMNMYEDYEDRYGYYQEKGQSKKEGKYFAAIIDFKDGQTIIEENIIKYKGFEFPIVESIIYSKKKLNKDKAYDYINYVHNESRCGAKLKEFKKVKNNYYYIKYKILSEC